MKLTHFKVRRLALASSGLLICAAGSAHATITPLSYYSNAYVNGQLNTSYTSALMGDVNFSVNGPYASQWHNGAVAQGSYAVPAGQTGITDPIYDVVTNGGQNGFSYSGQAQVLGTKLKTELTSSVVDINGNLIDSANNTNLWAQSAAYWSQGMNITSAKHAAGSYGAIVVGITLDGNFPALSDPSLSNHASAQLQANTSFTDTAGVFYSSNFSIYANPSTWSGSETVYKKLLFQYGTDFNLTLNQWLNTNNNGNAAFFNTGKISSIELPFAAVLVSGAEQAGLGTQSELYGKVTNSSTLDDPNTNWDFGNNGGGFTPPSSVPVPTTVWLFGSGLLGLIGFGNRRRQMA